MIMTKRNEKNAGGNSPPALFLIRFIQHILNKDAVALCGVADHHVRDSADEFPVLDDGGA